MITDKGKEIVGKYLLGQVNDFAGYVAVGCGARPQLPTTMIHDIDTIELTTNDVIFATVQDHTFAKDEVVNVSISRITESNPSAQNSSTSLIVSSQVADKVKPGFIVSGVGIIPGTYVNTVNTETDTITLSNPTIDEITNNDPVYFDHYISGNYIIKDVFNSSTFSIDNIFDKQYSSLATTGTVEMTLNVAKNALNFEMFRAPVIAKGFVKENSVTKLIFKAELPQDQQYKISEVALYPSKSNLRAGAYDSKLIAAFIPAEQWRDADGTELPQITSSIVDESKLNIKMLYGGISTNAAYVGDDNAVWTQPPRKDTYETPRFMNQSIMFAGAYPGSYIQSNSITLNLGQNSNSDLIKLAFALVTKVSGSTTAPANGYDITITFFNSNGNSAHYTQAYRPSPGPGQLAMNMDNRYNVVSVPLGSFEKDPGFLWSSIVAVRIGISIDDVAPDDWLILLDGLRLDNISTENPLYGMVGYNQIVTSTGQPILKRANSSNFIEYRFGLDIV